MFTKRFFPNLNVAGYLLFCLILLLAGCNSGGSSPEESNKEISYIEISPLDPSYAKEITLNLSVTVHFNDGSTFIPEESVSWNSSDTSVVIITDLGQFTTITVGKATITAKYGDYEVNKVITVNESILSSLQLEASNTKVVAGSEFSLTAFAIFNDGSKHEVTEHVEWTINNSSIVESIANNQFITLKKGAAQIVGSYQNQSAQIDIEVSSATLNQIDIEIVTSNIQLIEGDEIELKAWGIYSNDRRDNITEDVTWDFSNNNIIAFSTVDKKLKLISSGSVQISASASGIVGVKDIKILELINDAQLEVLQVTLPRHKMAIGTSFQLEATGINTDGSEISLTNFVSWSSESPATVFVYDSENKDGQIDALAVGTTKITATYDGKESSAEITVTDSILQDLNIELISHILPENSSIMAVVIGVYSDGNRQDLTSQVTWDSSDTSIISFKNVITNPGLIVSHNAGEAQISVSFGGIIKTTSLVVNNISLEEIHVAFDDSTISINTRSNISATGIYSDGSNREIGNIVSWATSNVEIATIESGIDQFKVIAFTPGDVTVTASLDGVSQSLAINVSDANLINVEISPQNIRLIQDENIQLSAIGEFSDGRTQNITDKVIWESSNPDIVFVSNEISTKGIIYALRVGEVNIMAGSNSVVKVTVSDAELRAINIDYPESHKFSKGTQKQLLATGVYSDGNTSDITHLVSWQTNNSEACTVSNFKGRYGLLNGIGAGNCTITARAGAVSTSSFFEVTTALLTAINIIPTEVSLALGTSLDLTAVGLYSDGSSQDITNVVTWQSDNIAVSLGDFNSDKIEMKGINVGKSFVTASFNDLRVSVSIDVTSAVLESIDISPVYSAIAMGSSKSLVATGYYSDGTSQVITDLVRWSSDDSSIATVSNENSNVGLVTALRVGVINISAQMDGIIEILPSIDIVSDPSAPVTVSLIATPFVILNDGIDSTVVEVKVNAVDNLAIVPDDTRVNLSIVSGDGVLSEESLLTVDGSASFDFTSTYSGVITIEASVEGTDITSTVKILSIGNFSNIIGRAVMFYGVKTDNIIEQDSIFGFLILNYSNREFAVERFGVANEDNLLVTVTDPAILNNNKLNAGEYVFVLYRADVPRINAYSAGYQLRDIATNTSFIISTSLVLR